MADSEKQLSVPGLKVFTDADSTRFCLPVAPSHMVYKNLSDSSARPLGEILEVAESVFDGKFGLMLQMDPQHALESAGDRTSAHHRRPLATLEVWSLEPDSFDLVLKLPAQTPPEVARVLLDRFIDRTHEASRVLDNLDLLRYEAGPALSLPAARQTLLQLERSCGTRLDSESLLLALKSLPN